MIINHVTVRSGKQNAIESNYQTSPSRRYRSEVTQFNPTKDFSPMSNRSQRSQSRSKSPQLKIWDPVVGEEDKIKRKKFEGAGTGASGKKDDPILLIKKREIITKYLPADAARDASPSTIIKKTEKAKYVDMDYNTAKRKIEALADQEIQTNIIEEKPRHGLSPGQNYTKERISKIEATEYLPPGYLDLDPILFKDDYEFLNKFHEKLFDDDQRRTKEIRRQQYNNRNHARVRDVIIYKIDYLKRRATEILERWFSSNSQPMGAEEILKWAQFLKIDPETFDKMQQIFLEEQTLFGAKNSAALNKMIYKDGNDPSASSKSPSRDNSKSSTPSKNTQSIIEGMEVVKRREDMLRAQMQRDKEEADRRAAEEHHRREMQRKQDEERLRLENDRRRQEAEFARLKAEEAFRREKQIEEDALRRKQEADLLRRQKDEDDRRARLEFDRLNRERLEAENRAKQELDNISKQAEYERKRAREEAEKEARARIQAEDDANRARKLAKDAADEQQRLKDEAARLKHEYELETQRLRQKAAEEAERAKQIAFEQAERDRLKALKDAESERRKLQDETDRLKEADREFRLKAQRELQDAEERAKREVEERNRQIQLLKEQEERRIRKLEDDNRRQLLELEKKNELERKRKEQERLSKFLDRLKRDAQSKHLVYRGDNSPHRSPEKLVEDIHQDLEESHFAERLQEHLQLTESRKQSPRKERATPSKHYSASKSYRNKPVLQSELVNDPYFNTDESSQLEDSFEAKQRELFNLLLDQERERVREVLEKEYERRLLEMRDEMTEEILVRKEISRKISSDQLWRMFRLYCENVSLILAFLRAQELPEDKEYQRSMMGMTFFYFIQKKLSQGEDLASHLETSCNEIIREDIHYGKSVTRYESDQH